MPCSGHCDRIATLIGNFRFVPRSGLALEHSVNAHFGTIGAIGKSANQGSRVIMAEVSAKETNIMQRLRGVLDQEAGGLAAEIIEASNMFLGRTSNLVRILAAHSPMTARCS